MSPPAGTPTGRWATALAGASVALQIPYPLVHGRARERLTVATVVCFCCASVSHAATSRGTPAALRTFLLSAGTGLLAEVCGVRTGVPFGRYAYTGRLGPRVAGVPLAVPLAWTMMAYPSLVVAARLTDRPDVQALLGGVGLAGWDLFLDPQMTAAGFWTWADGGGPRVNGIPAVNSLGWLLVGTAMSALLLAGVPALRRPASDDRVPLALFLWTWMGSAVAHGVFLRRPGVAAAGATGMGLLGVPLLRRLAPRGRTR